MATILFLFVEFAQKVAHMLRRMGIIICIHNQSTVPHLGAPGRTYYCKITYSIYWYRAKVDRIACLVWPRQYW